MATCATAPWHAACMTGLDIVRVARALTGANRYSRGCLPSDPCLDRCWLHRELMLETFARTAFIIICICYYIVLSTHYTVSCRCIQSPLMLHRSFHSYKKVRKNGCYESTPRVMRIERGLVSNRLGARVRREGRAVLQMWGLRRGWEASKGVVGAMFVRPHIGP